MTYSTYDEFTNGNTSPNSPPQLNETSTFIGYTNSLKTNSYFIIPVNYSDSIDFVFSGQNSIADLEPSYEFVSSADLSTYIADFSSIGLGGPYFPYGTISSAQTTDLGALSAATDGGFWTSNGTFANSGSGYLIVQVYGGNDVSAQDFTLTMTGNGSGPPNPNLFFLNGSLSTSSTTQGGTVNFTFTLENNGNGAAPASTVNEYVSASSSFSTSTATWLNSLPEDVIPSLTTVSTSLPTTLPGNLAPGQYYLYLVESQNGALIEEPITVTAASAADLVFTQASLSTSSIIADGILNFNYTLTNTGNTAAGSSSISEYVSTSPTFSAATSTSIGQMTVGPIGAGATSSDSIPLTLGSPAVSVGQYYLYFVESQSGAVDREQISITDEPPVIFPHSLTVVGYEPGQTLLLSPLTADAVYGSDYSPANYPLTITSISPTSADGGKLTLDTGNLVQYVTPAGLTVPPGGITPDSFQFMISDGHGENFGGLLFTINFVNPLFTTGMDSVNFNQLTNGQKLAIIAGSPIYDALGGNGDGVTLPSEANEIQVLGPGGQELGWHDTSQSLFRTSSLAGQASYVNGSNGNYWITCGAGNDTINIDNQDRPGGTGEGSAVIVAGSGNDYITIHGNGNNTITAGTGSPTIDLNGYGNNVLQVEGATPPVINGSVVTTADPAYANNGSFSFDFLLDAVDTFDGLILGTGDFYAEFGHLIMDGANLQVTGGINIQNAVLELTNVTSLGSAPITFFPTVGGLHSELLIDGATAPSNVIGGFMTSDVIDLQGLAYKSTYQLAFLQQLNSEPGGILQIKDTGARGAVAASLNLAGTYDASSFTLSQDSAGGTKITAMESSPVADDFNGDGTSDILAGGAGGILVDLSIKNGAVSGTPAYAATLSGGWSYLASGNYHGDVTSDILAQDSSGDIVTLPMQKGTVTGSPGYVTTFAGGWSYLATGDYYGNGTDDILAKDTAGDLAILPLKNGSISGAPSYVTTLPNGWSYLATGDFNGDGTDDILIRDNSGDLFDLTMKRGAVASSSYAATLTGGWSFLATGDFNGDRTTDILAQDLKGDIVDLTMKNGAVSGTSYVTTLSGGWSFLATGDFNGDGTTDILAHDTSGDVVALPIKNGTVSGSPTYVTTLSGGWKFTA